MSYNILNNELERLMDNGYFVVGYTGNEEIETISFLLQIEDQNLNSFEEGYKYEIDINYRIDPDFEDIENTTMVDMSTGKEFLFDGNIYMGKEYNKNIGKYIYYIEIENEDDTIRIYNIDKDEEYFDPYFKLFIIDSQYKPNKMYNKIYDEYENALTY